MSTALCYLFTHLQISAIYLHLYTSLLFIYIFKASYLFIYLFAHKLRVFENRLLRRIFGPKRDRVTGGWRKLHNKELHNLYSSPSIIRIIKSRMMRWAGHVA
jgi:hypothetical protein